MAQATAALHVLGACVATEVLPVRMGQVVAGLLLRSQCRACAGCG